MSLLQQLLVYLGAAIFAVLIFNRLKLGSILGYLAAGVVIGPAGLGLIDNVESVLHVAEFGVVLLLFLIGLELQPSRLWAMRRLVFGLGGVQVLVSMPLCSVAMAQLCNLGPRAAWVAGAGMSLSSTALALQLLSEKNAMASSHGRATFGVLLFQDLAVIPMLALLPLLSGEAAMRPENIWLSAARTVGVLVLVVGGKYVMRPLLRAIAKQRSQELFTAAALAVVVGTALSMQAVGLSMALGAFLAGVLLSDTEFRHELEADIAPFKGLLLGLFFIAVGMGTNIAMLLARPVTVFLCVTTLVALKGAVLWGASVRRLGTRPALKMAALASQGGEFAYVLFRLGVDSGALQAGEAELLVLVVTLSMATTPLLYALAHRLRPAGAATRQFDVSPTEAADVIIAGFGRVGQVIGRVLRAKNIGFTALDVDSAHIDFIKQFGAKAFYGDAARLDLLRAARADEAHIFVLAIDNIEASLRCIRTVREHFPHLTVVARARNRQHAYALMDLGITHVVRETFAATLQMTEHVLQAQGLTFESSRRAVEHFAEHDASLLQRSRAHVDNLPKLVELSLSAREELESLFVRDVEDNVS